MTKVVDRPSLRLRLEALHAASFGWALACCDGDRELAEEALQCSYVKVLEGRARWQVRSSFKTWLFGVIRNTVREVRRRRMWRRLSPFESAPSPVDPRPSSEAGLVTMEAVSALRRALARLGNRQRQVLHLVFYQEMTVEQAAATLGLRVGTARTHYQRGKARLRRLLAEETP